MTDQHDMARLLYVAMSALAGAITSLSLMPWKLMTWAEIALTLFVGFSCAIFLVPWLVGDLARVDLSTLRKICGVTYLGATSANVLLPVIIRRFRGFISKLFGDKEPTL